MPGSINTFSPENRTEAYTLHPVESIDLSGCFGKSKLLQVMFPFTLARSLEEVLAVPEERGGFPGKIFGLNELDYFGRGEGECTFLACLLWGMI